jgi:outer membrane protein assembly factor BamB
MNAALRLVSTLCALGFAIGSSSAGDGHWPHWRGPEGTGVAPGALPTSWSDTENLKWKVEVEGRGFSTPVIWGDKLFLTTAVPMEEPTVEEPPASDESGGRGRRPSVRHGKQSYQVHAYDRGTGKLLWKQVAIESVPHEGYHSTYGSFASYSPVTDGKRLYVSFGSKGLYCYDTGGKQLWKKDLGVKLIMRNSFGEGANPAVHGDTLVHVFDHEEDSFMVALDTGTGEERWRVERDEPSSWATPLIIEHDGVWQVVTSATNRVRSHTLADGKLIWECGGLGANAIPNPLRYQDTILAMTGYRNDNCMAIKLGGKGDLTDSDAVLWSGQKGLSYTASPVLAGGRLYAVMDRGFISCFDAKTGTGHYVEQRLPRGSSLKASPIAAGGKLYVPTEAGDVHVIALGDELEVLATNSLTDQFFVASPVAAEGELFLRSQTHLICISEAGG